jgi:aminopeptidase N
MRDAQPKAIFLKDYSAPDFLIDKTALHFSLSEEKTIVTSTLQFRRNPDLNKSEAGLVLNGQNFVLKSLLLDGQALAETEYQQSAETLTINNVPDQFELSCITELKPQENTSLEGLYKSKTMFCTQCEAEGFRNITYYLDRPDVMSVFSTTIEADKSLYPVLLSNGNNVDSGVAENGRHWVRWDDPFKKPAYLFALVAGDLEFIEDKFTTMNAKQVCLRIYVEGKDIDKCDHAMGSLINAMRWDEEVYGREYDLSIFNIVAVDDFNMGAMENKSLNIFNTSCVLAKPETTTDAGFQRVEAVVAHEYFHNWSGNRVTCRDWFQLSLKEGFTVYRDAEFSSDMGSRTVKRVEDVSLLRTVQFSEDAGPMSHPVRPESFIEISNFYTVTIYEKGAEVVRMIANLLGPDLFRKGSDLYFDRHDGQAVTCEDFVRAMEDASGISLKQFRLWYSQAGTPLLKVTSEYDESKQTLTIQVDQNCPATPGQDTKQAFHIPLSIGLIGQHGELPLQLSGHSVEDSKTTEMVLDINQTKQEVVFEKVSEKPVLSLLRGFSAPVKLVCDYSRDELQLLMSKDTDGFVRWDAAQQLGVQVLNDMIAAHQSGEEMVLDDRLVEAYRVVLADESLDKAMVALMLQLPTEAYLAEINDVVDVHAIHAARIAAQKTIAKQLEDQLWQVFNDNQLTKPYEASASQIAARSLKNTALSYLLLLESDKALSVCLEQFKTSKNMTDTMAALKGLLDTPFAKEKADVLESFYLRWKDESLVVNQWFMAQAVSPLTGTLQHIKTLMKHPAFDIKNPNKVRSLIGAFCGQNSVNFHQADGEGYRFLSEQILQLNRLNPQVASRMLGPLTKWRKYPVAQQRLMKAELEKILAQEELSRDVFEVVSKSLVA